MWKKRKGKSRSLQKVFDNRQLNIKHCYKVFCISTPLSYTFHFDTFTTEWRCNIMDNFQSWLTWKQQYEYAELFTVWHSFVQDGSKKCSPPYSCIEEYQWKYVFGCWPRPLIIYVTVAKCGEKRHSTEVAFALLTQQPRVRFPAFPWFFSMEFSWCRWD